MEDAKSFKELNKFKVVELKEYCKKLEIKPERLKKDIINQILKSKEENIIDDVLEPENIVDEGVEPEPENIIDDSLEKLKKELEFYKNKVIEIEKKIEEYGKPKLKFIDLFCGTGAFSYVFSKNNKFDCTYANDMEKSSQMIFKLNHKNVKFVLNNLNLIETKNIPKHNMLCGGFPCQPFSIAGEQKGFNDERSNVFWKIIEIIQYHKPEIIILENVKNLKSHDKGNTFKIILEQLTKNGYFVKDKVLDTSKYTNVPQHRERIYIVCFKDKLKYNQFNFDFEEIKNNSIRDFLEEKIDDKYYYTDKLKVYDTVKEDVIKHINENVLYQYRRYYVRENKSNCCPTLTANMGGGGHNVPLLLDDRGIRKLTPRECFNLQGFPKNYLLPELSDSALYKLAGNAVSIPIVELIKNKISKLI